MNILIVEDNTVYRTDLANGLKDKFTVISVGTIDAAKKALEQTKNIPFIIMDGNLSSPGDGVDFVQKIAATYDGLIIANSSEETVNDALVLSGCQYPPKVKGKKHTAEDILLILEKELATPKPPV